MESNLNLIHFEPNIVLENITKISELKVGDIVRHKHDGDGYVVLDVDVINEKAVLIKKINASCPWEWLKVTTNDNELKECKAKKLVITEIDREKLEKFLNS